MYNLSPKQTSFCHLYATSHEEFGNGVQAYAKAYGLDLNIQSQYNTAKASAHRLLTKDYILDRINSLLSDSGLNKSFVDKQLCFLITQNTDLNVKLRAIQEFNKLRRRYDEAYDKRNEEKIPRMNLTVYQNLKEKTEEELQEIGREQLRIERQRRQMTTAKGR